MQIRYASSKDVLEVRLSDSVRYSATEIVKLSEECSLRRDENGKITGIIISEASSSIEPQTFRTLVRSCTLISSPPSVKPKLRSGL